MADKVRAHAIISGRVQGVFYRMETQRAADRIGVTGWVKNRPEGTVEAVFEGAKNQVDAVLKWCWDGPRLAALVPDSRRLAASWASLHWCCGSSTGSGRRVSRANCST